MANRWKAGNCAFPHGAMRCGCICRRIRRYWASDGDGTWLAPLRRLVQDGAWSASALSRLADTLAVTGFDKQFGARNGWHSRLGGPTHPTGGREPPGNPDVPPGRAAVVRDQRVQGAGSPADAQADADAAPPSLRLRGGQSARPDPAGHRSVASHRHAPDSAG